MEFHSHEPNYEPPSADPTICLVFADGMERLLTVADLRLLPVTVASNCFIVTDHGTIGPFTFEGVATLDLARRFGAPPADVAVMSGDGFATRLTADDLHAPAPPLLCYGVDGRPLKRQEGLVRLIVPGDQDNALRQVKWVSQVRFGV